MGVKVAEVTIAFWVIKILTTGMGETASDFMIRAMDPVLAVLGTGIVLLALLIAQVTAQRYRHWLYWSTVAMVSVVGTMVADALHVVVGVSYSTSALVFACVTVAIFTCWYTTQSTIAVHSITTRPRELFYWAAVMATFALGTAVGDLTASSLGLGYLASGVLFAVLIAVPAVGYRWLAFPPVLAFWSAYVLTRPLGASFADWFAVPAERGGLGLSTVAVTAVLIVAIAAFVARTAPAPQPAPRARTADGIRG